MSPSHVKINNNKKHYIGTAELSTSSWDIKLTVDHVLRMEKGKPKIVGYLGYHVDCRLCGIRKERGGKIAKGAGSEWR